MIPPVVAPETPSSERRVFEALKTASSSSNWIVLHSLGFSSAWTGEFGEIDFVVIIPGLGIICVAVKGGDVSHKDGVWSTRRHGSSKIEILKRSPFRQAQEGMWKLKQSLDAKFGPGSTEARCPIGWIVILPAVNCPPITTEFGRDEVVDQSDLDRDIGDRIRKTPSIMQLARDIDLADAVTQENAPAATDEESSEQDIDDSPDPVTGGDTTPEVDTEMNAASMFLPSTMGVSFLADVSGGLQIEAKWGTYQKESVDGYPGVIGSQKNAKLWFRTPGHASAHLAAIMQRFDRFAAPSTEFA